MLHSVSPGSRHIHADFCHATGECVGMLRCPRWPATQSSEPSASFIQCQLDTALHLLRSPVLPLSCSKLLWHCGCDGRRTERCTMAPAGVAGCGPSGAGRRAAGGGGRPGATRPAAAKPAAAAAGGARPAGAGGAVNSFRSPCYPESCKQPRGEGRWVVCKAAL